MLDTRDIGKVLDIKARFVDVTLQENRLTRIMLKDGTLKEVTTGTTYGAGARVLGKVWGFASSNDPSHVLGMAEKALKTARGGNNDISFAPMEAVEDRIFVKAKKDPQDVDISEKIKLLRSCEEGAREVPGIASTTFSYIDSRVETLYMNSEGSRIETSYPKVFLSAAAFAKDNGKLQVGFERLGATGGFEAMTGARDKAREASERANRLLHATKAPSGSFKVVLDPLLTGVFIHEALGHAVEADHILQDESILKGQEGARIASDMVTICDDPTLEGSFGFYFYDSEGVKGRKKTLVEGGVLKGFLHSRETASAMGSEPTGNARGQGYNHQPVVRMSNTYLEPGDHSFTEMIEDIKDGVYLKGSKGGEVDTIRGVFQFSAEEGFLIRNGELADPIDDVALSGETLAILKDVDAVGRDFGVHVGFCGKASQTVPVGDGGPHLRTVAAVGGTGLGH
jgi:TldD protein